MVDGSHIRQCGSRTFLLWQKVPLVLSEVTQSEAGFKLGSVRCQSLFTFHLRQGTRRGAVAGAARKKAVHRGGKIIYNIELRYQVLGDHYARHCAKQELYGHLFNYHHILKESRHLGSNPHSAAQTLLCDLGPIAVPLWTSLHEGSEQCCQHCSPLTGEQ